MKYRAFLSLITFLIFSLNLSFAQKKNISYEELKSKIEIFENKPVEQWEYIKIYISQAKKEKDLNNLRRGYVYASFNRRGTYSDSIVDIAKKIGGNNLLGDSYLSLGMTFMANENYPKALKNFLEGYKYIKKGSDLYLLHNNEYLIAKVKNYLGLYHEADELFEKTTDFFKSNNSTIDDTDYRYYYIYSLLANINNNLHVGKLKDNERLINDGKEFIRKNKDFQSYYPYFISAEGATLFFQKKYTQAIDKIEDALIIYNDNWPHLTDNFFVGMSFWKINKKKEALPYFFILDKEYNKTKKLDPSFRPAFEMLINYYSEKGNYQKQLEYVNKLISLDKIYERDYNYLYKTLDKEYDTKRLEKEKVTLEKSIQNQKIINIVAPTIVLILFIVLLYFLRRSYLRRKHFQKLYNDFIKENDVSNDNNIEVKNEQIFDELDINPLIVANVLNELSIFEKNKLFLNKDITLSTLAKKCGTNTSYLSKIINHYKEKNYAEYINDLRLNYIVNSWKTRRKSRYLSIQETAEKAGYNSTQAFAKNFQEKYKIPPSAFLSSLNEKENSK